MSNYSLKEYTEKCPYCGSECEADWVDVDVSLVQCGPFHCENCGASEIGPYDDEYQEVGRQYEIFTSRQLDLYGKIVDKFIVAPESSKR